MKEYYKVSYQSKPSEEVIIEKFDDDNAEGMLTSIYSYVDSKKGTSGIFAVRKTKNEGINALKKDLELQVERHMQIINEYKRKLEIIKNI